MAPNPGEPIPEFFCTKCGKPGLFIALSMQLGPDDHSDDRAIQIAECKDCGFEGVAWYEGSRRGNDERFHHFVHDTTVAPMVKSTVRLCAAGSDSRCRCFGHELMRKCVADPNWLSAGNAVPLRRCR